MTVLDVVKQFRSGVAVALSLVVIEYVAWIVEPSVFGPVIDALIAQAGTSGAAIPVAPIALWIGVFVLNSGVGALRRSLDQRIFLSIFRHIATTIADRAALQGLSPAKTAARVELSKEYISFLQYRVPELIEQVIAIGGALIGLAFFDYRIAATCFVIIFPLATISAVYNRNVLKLQAHVHDSTEDLYEVFRHGDAERVRHYLEALSISQQKIAHVGAASFGLMRLFLLGIFLAVLYIAIDLDNFTTGNIYTIVAYLWTFVTSSEYLPELMESWTSLRELSHRLKHEPAEL